MIVRRVLPFAVVAVTATAACTPPNVASTPRAARLITYAFTLKQAPDSVSVEVFVPPAVKNVRAIVAFVARSVDQYAFDDRDWRLMCGRLNCALLRIQLQGQSTPDYEARIVKDASAGGGDALLRSLAVAATETAHPELKYAKLILFGHSAAGSFVVTMANRHPDRVLGFIRYHSIPLGAAVDTNVLRNISALTIVGGRDAQVGLADSRALWQVMRSRQARWAYVNHIDQPHFSVEGLLEAGGLMRAWIEGTLQTATSATGGLLVEDASGRPVPDESVSRNDSSWVPNLSSAFEIKRLSGVCGVAPLSVARQILGQSARLISETVFNCRYSTDSLPKRDLVIAVNQAGSEADALARTKPTSTRPSTPVPTVADGALYSAFDLRQQRCGSLIAVRASFITTVSLCGPGFGTIADTAALNPIARRFLSMR
jgi:pimeloyl-ACP methyl ester carboxylesterase